MAQQAELIISGREVLGKATRRLRKAGIIPANIFGHHETPQAIQITAADYNHFRRAHKASEIVTLRVPGDDASQTALIRHVQHDPRSGKILHIDFVRVSLTERMTVKVPIHLIGEAPAVKLANGVLLQLLETLEITCQASEIPEFFEVDISSLNEIDAVLHASDIKLPADMTLNTDPGDPIAKVSATRAETTEVAEGETPAPEAAAAQPAEGGAEA